MQYLMLSVIDIPFMYVMHLISWLFVFKYLDQ